MSKEKVSYLGKLVDFVYPDLEIEGYSSTPKPDILYKNAYVYEQSAAADDNNAPSYGVILKKKTGQHEMRYSVREERIKEIVGDKPTQEQIDFMLGMAGDYGCRIMHNNFSGISLGSDPEVFAVDEKGFVVPAFDFCGAKADIEAEARRIWGIDLMWQKLHNSYKNNIPFWDGFQAEWMTSAHRCLEGLTQDVGRGLYNTHKNLMRKHPSAKLVSDNLVEIPEHMLLTAAEEHVQFGCSPSKNAYNTPPLAIANGREVGIRAAGVHIHFGIGDTPNKAELVKLLDASMGIASVAMFGKEEDHRRRELYGRAGEYRTPAHGLEYRVLSSAVLQHPYRFHLMVDMGRYVMRLGMAGLLGFVEFAADPQACQAVINNNDIEGARELLAKNKKFWQEFFKRSYNNTKPWKWLMDGHQKTGTIFENWWMEDNVSGVGASCCVRNAK
jgi:Phage phiEco32-like COOH.NH2 ligase-type 2